MKAVPVRNAMPFAETVAWLQEFSITRDPDVEAKARLLLLDTVACAVAGMGEPELKALSRGLAVSSGGTAQWPGAQALTPASAAFLAATAACWHEACEGLARAHGRPGLHAIPVAVSLGLSLGASLGQVLDAVVYGYEIGGRAGEAMRIRPGLHVDGTWGILASAAAAARIRKFEASAIMQTLAMAACQIPVSLYAPISAGRTARNTYVGHAASIAIYLADAVAAGVSAPEDIFDQAGRGLGNGDMTTVWPWAEPGEYLILQGYLKPFAAVRHVHYAAACALQCFARYKGDTKTIKEIRLQTYPEALTYCANRAAATPIQAQFSLTHGVAFALRHGSLGPEAYAPQIFSDAEHKRLEAMITLHADPAISHRGARLIVVTDQSAESYAVDSVPGDPGQPLSAEDTIAKAKAYISSVLSADAAQSIVAQIMTAPLDAPFSLSRTPL